MEKSGTIDGVKWSATIDATASGQFRIRGIDVTDRDGKRLPRYEERTATHDNVDGAIAEAEQLAKSIARSE
ncbi:MAG TPA: hypothetical protein VFV97_05075 [Rhodanobacteraceae bacterium]|nr:hypothetical protein [Rhodanobacteraceae bacterium]